MKPLPDLTDMAFAMFDKMGFLLAESADKGDFIPEQVEEAVRGEIKFKGTLNGSLNMVTTKRLSEILASNILGMPDSDIPGDTETADAIKEFLNVYCGNIMAEVTEKEDSVDLLVPEKTSCSVDYMKGVVHNPESVFVIVEGEPAAFLFVISK